ncbi:hypothetical protein K501DRAFT_266171 [Backusella circina FSU 941]|nr:hypothetical protein K501DRAFT_266171 [Backusella circina FSU 941]
MRFSVIATAIALALTVDATAQVSRRDLRPASVRCTTSIKVISDYLPSFTSSIEKVTSYTSVIAAHAKEDKVEKKLRAAIKECNKVTSAKDEEVIAFINIVKELVDNIKDTTAALNSKRHMLESIPMAKPLIEDSLLTIYEDAVALEDHLLEVCPEKYRDEFTGYIKELNDALEASLDLYDIEH